MVLITGQQKPIGIGRLLVENSRELAEKYASEFIQLIK